MIELSYPGDLTDVEEMTAMLSAAGLSAAACRSKAILFAKATESLAVTQKRAAEKSPIAFFVPGRIEVIGKHTDYAGGRTMNAAIERGFCITALPRNDHQVVIIDAATGETIVFTAEPELKLQQGWANYPMTVVRRIARNFSNATRGADISFISDLPQAAGLGSSSALITAMFLVMSEINNLPASNEYWHNIGGKTDLAGYLGTIENGQTFGKLAGDRGVGTFGGSEDHTAILCSEPGSIRQYAFCPVEFEQQYPIPRDCVFVIGSSGVVAEKTGAAKEKYNRISRLASTLIELWRKGTGRDDPHLAAALGSSPDALERFCKIIETAPQGEFSRESLLDRLDQFALECGEVIPSAGDALAGENVRAFGRAVDRSQHAAESLLGNQTPETIFLAASARRLGAAAASAFGAGFGGSVWALVATNRVDNFLDAWAKEYRETYPDRAATSTFFATAAGPAAFRIC